MEIELAPRDERNRYRIYRLRRGELQLLATTDSKAGVGVAICTLAEEDEFERDDAVGVLDCLARGPGKPGKWRANPYATGR